MVRFMQFFHIFLVGFCAYRWVSGADPEWVYATGAIINAVAVFMCEEAYGD